jgi:hypothetical protein
MWQYSKTSHDIPYHLLLNEWMNVSEVGAWLTLTPRPFPDLLCVPIPFNLLVAPYRWSTVSYIVGSHDSHLVSWNAYPSGEILIQVRLHNHIGYVRLFIFHYGTFHRQGCLLSSVWRGIPLGDSALLTGLSLVLPGFCLALRNWQSFWQRAQRENCLRVFVVEWTASVPGVLCTASPW